MISDVSLNMKQIFENMNDVVYKTDTRGVLKFISSSCRAVLGYNQHALIGKKIFENVHEHDASEIMRSFQKGIDTKREYKIEYQYKHALGHYIWLETKGRIILDHDGEVVGAVFCSHDISDRKLLERKQNVFANLSHDMMGTANTEGYFVELNNAFEQVLGWRIEELLSKPYLSFVHVEDYESTIRIAEQLADGIKVESFLNRYICKDGTYRWLSWNLSLDIDVSLIYFVASDVTKQIADKENLERKILENEYFLRSTIDNIQGVVYHCNNDQQCTMNYLSQGCYELTGYMPDELINNSMVSFGSLLLEEFKLNLLSSSNANFEHEYQIKTKNDGIKWVLDRGKTIFSEDGQAIRQEGILTDITNIKNNEEKLEKYVRELYQKDQYLNSIMETQEEMICRFLPDTTLTFANKAYCKCLKHTEDQLIGRKFLELIPQAEHNEIMYNLGKLTLINPSISYIQQLFDDEKNEIWQEWVDTAIFNSENEILEYQGVGRDITINKLIEQKIANSLDLLQKTQSIARIGSYEVDLIGDTCKSTCKSSPFLNELLGIDSLEMHSLDIWPLLIHNDDKERVLLAHHKSVISGCDFNQDYRIIRESDGVVLWVHDIGTIEFNNVGIPSKLSGTIMDVTNQMKLINELKLMNQKVIAAYDSTIEGWAYALEMKEEETKEHSIRVTDLTLNIAKKLNIDEDYLVHIKRGAILHDIGKMGIPDSILLKPGKLDENEWMIMKKHPHYALDMLSSIEYLKPALDIPYCHHEKWDGTGYPRALKGEEIPLAARVFAVVDVFDALTSERPYKKAWDKEKAINYIFENSGSHFDPKVVEVFKDILK